MTTTAEIARAHARLLSEQLRDAPDLRALQGARNLRRLANTISPTAWARHKTVLRREGRTRLLQLAAAAER